MKRSFKNIIMLLLCILLLGGMVFTYSNAKESIKQTSNNNEQMMSGNTPKEMPNDSSSGSIEGEPPEKPDGNGNEQQGTPPEKPSNGENEQQEGSNTEESNNQQEPPEKPDGNGENQGTPPDMPNNENNNSSDSLDKKYYILFGVEGLLLSIIFMYLLLSRFNKKSFKETFKSSDKLVIYFLSIIILTGGITYGSSYLLNNKSGSSSTEEKMVNPNDNNSSNVSYSSKTEIKEDTTITSGTYESTESDENAISVTGDVTANISNIEVNKTGDSDGGDNTSFYGTNSAVIAKDGATLNLKNIKVTTDANGANGVFSYGGSATTNNSSGDGTTINISDSTITTSKNNSGGIMTTGGGVMNATNLTVTTAGTSSAAIRSDRGGGTVNVDGGTYKTNGQGSPAIYSTAKITVKNATLTSTASEGIVIEGKNSVEIDNVTLTDTNNKLNGQSTTSKNIFLCQSMSGDAAEGNSTFTAKNSTITTNKGDTFYITNTSSTITLTNNKIVNNDSTGNFLRAEAAAWGNNGTNGGDVTLVMSNQEASGNIVIDKISTLEMTMKDSSYYEGTINKDNSAKSIKLVLDKSSKIKLTGDSYITSLEDEDSTYSNIDFNGYKLYVNGKAIN